MLPFYLYVCLEQNCINAISFVVIIMIVKTHDENWESLFRNCLNESLPHDTGTRTTKNPNLSILTSSTFGGDGLVPQWLYLL
jgi:hypothetical protein